MTFILKDEGANWSQLPQGRCSKQEVPITPVCFPKFGSEAAFPPGSGCCWSQAKAVLWAALHIAAQMCPWLPPGHRAPWQG